MTDDPGIAYAGPESRSFEVIVIAFDGSATVARGVIANLDTSAGEAGQPYAMAGAVLWIAYDGDAGQIEFVQYSEAGSSRTLHRRAIKSERVSSRWNTVKCHLAADMTVLPPVRADFSSADFGPDFNAG